MISTMFAGILGLLFFVMSIETIQTRRREKISLGHGDHNKLNQLVSSHGNFAAYVPILLITLNFIESSNLLPQSVVLLLGFSFTIGRFLHYLAFRKEMNFPLRVKGMQLTLFPLLLQSLICFWIATQKIWQEVI